MATHSMLLHDDCHGRADLILLEFLAGFSRQNSVCNLHVSQRPSLRLVDL